MEIESFYRQLPYLDRRVIDEFFRTFIRHDFRNKHDIDEGFNKVTTAIAYFNLVAYDPKSITAFHEEHIQSFFSSHELVDLYKLFALVLKNKAASPVSFA